MGNLTISSIRLLLTRLSEVEPRTNQVTSSKQWEMLVRFLEKHPAIATCTFITNNAQRVVARRLWNDISVVLNKLEAAYHSSEQWKRVSTSIGSNIITFIHIVFN